MIIIFKRKTWIALAVCCSVMASGVVWASLDNADQRMQNEQKQKERAGKAAFTEDETNPRSAQQQFDEMFAGYKDLYLIESTYYASQKDSTDPAVQKVLYELEKKGELIQQFEEAANHTKSADALLESFHEATEQLNRELYPERYQ